MVVINKSVYDVYLTNIPFLICYITLFGSMFYLHKKEKLIDRLFFAVISIPALAFTLDTICDAYFFIPFKSIINFEAYAIFLFPLYLYLGFLYRFSHKQFYSAFVFLFLGTIFEIAVMKLGYNIPDVIRFFWLIMFICMNLNIHHKRD